MLSAPPTSLVMSAFRNDMDVWHELVLVKPSSPRADTIALQFVPPSPLVTLDLGTGEKTFWIVVDGSPAPWVVRVPSRAHRRRIDLCNPTVYIHRMVRTQLYLDEKLHARLKELARLHGRTVSDLVRDALTRVYAPPEANERLSTLRAVEGIWRDREDVEDAGAFVRRLRRDTRRQPKQSR